jgi:FkbM family methyltransferase
MWEPHVEAAIKNLVKLNQVCLDIGANIGYFTNVLSKAVGENGKVFAFEPVRNTFFQLESTISQNNLTNASIFNFGVGDCNSSVEIRYDISISGNASIYRKGDELKTAETIKIRRLDDFAEGALPYCDFIKIDVEGNEINFIKGAIEYLKKSKPIILYEFNKETACLAGYEICDMVKTINLIDSTYTHFIIWGDGHLIEVDFNSLQVPLGAHIDCVAIPHKKGS